MTSQIELVGVPGSGKTYHSVKMANAEKGTIVSIGGKFERFFFTLCFLVFHPMVFFSLLHKTVTYPQIYRNTKHKVFFLFFGACAKEFKSNFYKRAIIDEGIMQYLFSLHEYEIQEGELDKSLNILTSLKRRVVYLTAPNETVRLKRLQKRGRTFRSYMGTANQEIYTAFFLKNEKHIMNFLKDNYRYSKIKN